MKASAPGPVTAWWLALRPRTLPAVMAPVLTGQWLASQQGGFDGSLALLILLCALSLQLAVNLANDVFDFRSGVDRGERLGPARAAQQGWLSERQLFFGVGVALLIAALSGIWLVVVGGCWFLLLGSLSIVAALAYSGGPFPLASNGLGELTVFLFFGLLAVTGGFYLQTGFLTMASWLYGGALGSLTAAIMLVNNLRDRSSDAQAGKHTLALVLGERFSRWLYVLLIVPPSALLLASPLAITVFLLCALALARTVFVRSGGELNRQLGQTVLLCMVFALLAMLAGIPDMAATTDVAVASDVAVANDVVADQTVPDRK